MTTEVPDTAPESTPIDYSWQTLVKHKPETHPKESDGYSFRTRQIGQVLWLFHVNPGHYDVEAARWNDKFNLDSCTHWARIQPLPTA